MAGQPGGAAVGAGNLELHSKKTEKYVTPLAGSRCFSGEAGPKARPADVWETGFSTISSLHVEAC